MDHSWVPVCPRSALRRGEMRLVDTGKAEIVVADVDGELYAFGAICTHALGYLDEGELQGHQIICPLHDGRFDVRTGAVTSGPPEEPIAVYKVATRNDVIHVSVPE